MKKIFTIIVSILLLICTVLSVSAINWNGLNSGSVSSSTTATSANSGASYTIPDDDDNVFVGVRCSVVNSSGVKRGRTVDVYFTTKSSSSSTKISEHGLDVIDGKVASTGTTVWFFGDMRNKFQCIDALNNVSTK